MIQENQCHGVLFVLMEVLGKMRFFLSLNLQFGRMAFTFAEHRGKGYLKKSEANCLLQLKSKGLPMFLHINEHNEASLRAAKSLGFERSDLVAWLRFEKSN